MSKPDPNNPNVIALANLLDELNMEWIRTHPESDDAELLRQVEADRRIRQQMFRPVPVRRPAETA